MPIAKLFTKQHLRKFFVSLLCFAFVAGPLFSFAPIARAATITGFIARTYSDGTAQISWASLSGIATYDLAAGAPTVSGASKYCLATNYGWFSGLKTPSVSLQKLPTNGSELCVRVFPNGTTPATDYFFNAYSSSSSQPAPATELVQAPAPQTSGAIAETYSDGTAKVTWPAISSASYYSIAAGRPTYDGSSKFCLGVEYGWGENVAANSTIIPLNSVKLPTDGSELCVRIFPNGNTPAVDYFFSAYKTAAPAPTPAPAPVQAPAPISTPTTSTTTAPTPTSPTPTPEPAPAIAPAPATPAIQPNPAPLTGGNLALWANDGGDKITKDELRATKNTGTVVNSVWDGSKIKIFGAKNEVVDFNAILEAASQSVGSVSVSFDKLSGPNNYVISGKPASGSGLYNWAGRNIELFYIRYLEIKGLSAFMSMNYDENHRPESFRATSGLWKDRPDHNKLYPEIAVPYELHDGFTVPAGTNQSIWADIYIPKDAPAGVYTGVFTVKVNGANALQSPVELTVKNFSLPDVPSSKTMLFLGYADINKRYLNEPYPYIASDVAQMEAIRDRHFQLAHRHKISLIDGDFGGENWTQDAPRPQWKKRLDGTLFTAANGYDGPGVGVGNNIYAIGAYGSWSWQNEGQSGMWKHTDNWANWFSNNAPQTESFLYLIDESDNYAQIEQWSQWMNNNPGQGKQIKSMVTMPAPSAAANTPSLDIAVSGMYVGDTAAWQNAVNKFLSNPDKKFFMYNGSRPGQGTFMMEDDGVALRELAWGQYKKGIQRWFYWESTYYNNYQGGTGQTNVFQQAQTFGSNGITSASLGQTGWNYSNGDGVMFYPGTDKVYQAESYNIPGPIASLRLKHWRRGIQDVDYLTLAEKINPTRVKEIVNSIVPKVLWEYGVDNPSDPTYVHTNISWSSNPDVWEAARRELASIIESSAPAQQPVSPPAAATTSTLPNNSGLIMWLKLDEPSGATAFKDASGNGRDGACAGVNCPSAAAGQNNGAFSFDGKNDSINAPGMSAVSLGKNFTFDAWVYPQASGNYKIIAAKRNAYFFALHNLKPAVFLAGVKSQWYIGNKAVPLNAWSRVTFTYDGAQIKMYINGALDRAITGLSGNVLNNSKYLWIGTREDFGGYWFKGRLDEIKFYNRALAESEIK